MVETLIALVLSSFVIVLASHAFLVQNRFYSTQTLRTAAQDNVRASTELMAREIRTAVDGGIVVAGARTLTVRSPIAVITLCSRSGGEDADFLVDGGVARLDTEEVAGLAHRDPLSGSWTMAATTWANIDDGPRDADDCADNGADTVGVSEQFHRIRRLDDLFSPTPSEGDVLMLFRETTFKIQPSVLDPSTLGIFRAPYGEAFIEFATGVDTTAQFQYRMSGSYVDTVPDASLAMVDAVRLVTDARKAAPTGGVDDITFGWSVNVPLRTVR